MIRLVHALLAAVVGLSWAGCERFGTLAPGRCEKDSECPSGYSCLDSRCHADDPSDGAVGADVSGPDRTRVDGARADVASSDAAVRDAAARDAAASDATASDAAGGERQASDVEALERAANDAEPGLDLVIADVGGDARRDDASAPDTQADSGPRGIGDPCQVDGECQSDFCRPSDSTCQAPTCGDGYRNQDETEVDCGGAWCDPCPTCWGNATNFEFEDARLDFATAVDLTECSGTIDTSLAPASMLDVWCGPRPAPVVQAQPDGPSIVVVPMVSLVIGAGQTLRLLGDKPVVLAVRGDATILGTIDAGARGTTPGAGGDLSTDGAIATAGGATGTGDCSVFENGTGQGMNQEPGNYSLGGGGAGFRTNGGFGGGERPNYRCYSNQPQYTQVANGYECKPLCPDDNCDNSFSYVVNRYQANNGAHYTVAPVRGLAAPDQSLTPLRGGCAGGRGEARASSTAYYGGSGGGAVQLTATGTLTIGAGGIVSAAGGGGTVIGAYGSGSGGGSGGAILLEATVVDVSAASGIRAHGGSGGGRDNGGGCSGRAEDGHLSDDNYATHSVPSTCVAEGRGGLSRWNVGSATCNGTGASIGSALQCTLPIASWPTSAAAYPQGGTFSDDNGGGGGGGSGGVIIVRRLQGSGGCP